MLVYILKTEGDFQVFDFAYSVPPDPLEEGNYLMPSIPYAEIAPPETLAGEIAVFNAGAWRIEPDLRGTVYWVNGVEYQINEIGVPLPEGASLTPPQTAPFSISTAQGQLALIEYGKYQAAVDFINAIPDPIEKLKAEVNFYRRNDWQRDNPTLLALAQGLGISEAELDQMFIFGSTQ